MKNSSVNTANKGERVLHLKKKFLYKLKEYPGYPFNEYEDGAFFHYAYEKYPYVDLIKELDKKIAWWKKHPKALVVGGKFHRAQLDDWFQIENEYQKMEKK
jgi:hypothetical protein